MTASGSPGIPDSGPATAADAFVHAVVWGEHTVVWELLSSAGRTTALRVAQRNGMDRVAAGRIRDGLADPEEMEEFLRQLLAGVRRDLRSVDLGELKVGAVESDRADTGQATAHLVVPSIIPGADVWSAGRLVLSCVDKGRWRVDSLEPRVTGP